MKNKMLLIACLLMVNLISFGNRDANQTVTQEKTIKVCCAPGVEQLTETITQEFVKNNQPVNLKFEPTATSNLSEKGLLTIVPEHAETAPNGWKMLIGRHIIVPVTHAQNPNLEALEQQGISANRLRQIITNHNAEGQLNFYLPDDEQAQKCFAEFLAVQPEAISKLKIHSKEEMALALQNDKTAIGFCCLLNLADGANSSMAENFKIIPIDKNENGRVDYHEEVYRPLDKVTHAEGTLSKHELVFGSLDGFKRGVWIGKYPRQLVNDLYVVSERFPEGPEMAGFISWLITDGQQFMEQGGFSELVYNERQSKLNDLQPLENGSLAVEAQVGGSKAIWYLIGLSVFAAIILFAYGKRKSNTGVMDINSGRIKVFNEAAVEVPNGLYFDKTHTWTFMEKDGSVKVGIDDFMQHVTGKFTNVRMKQPGERLTKNEPLVTLAQNGKHIEIFAPVSGKIKEINEDLVIDPAAINNSPYTEGWLYSIEPSNWQREISFLKMAGDYKTWLKKEFARLKDFLAASVNAESNQQPAFQDGGELNNYVLQDLGPKTWEDFQKNFIETSDLN